MSDDRRMAPVQGDQFHGVKLPAGEVPWAVHLMAWNEYARQGHGSQSAERLAERNGFSWGELIGFLRGQSVYSNGADETFDELWKAAGGPDG